MHAPPIYLELKNAAAKSAACTAITQTIPEWFGITASNQMYAAQIRDKDVFAAMTKDRPDGLVALRYHFERTAEIWWMGVRAEMHRLGIGSNLMAMALKRAQDKQCHYVVLNTLSPKSPDMAYAETRLFYSAHGFEPLLNFNEDDSVNPMMWMIRRL